MRIHFILRNIGGSRFMRLITQESGNIIIMAAVAIPMLFGAIALAVDLNRYLKSGAYIQNAVDQAALAAISVDGQDRTEVATRFFNASLTDSVRSYVNLKGITIDEQFPPGGPLSITVTANVEMRNTFGSFVGVDSTLIRRLGQATRLVEKVEAVITLASNGTMCSHKDRQPDADDLVSGDTLLRLTPDPTCVDFESMRTGVESFVKKVNAVETISDVKVGLVPYNFKVRMPNLSLIPPTLSSNEPADYYSDVADAEPLSPVLPLTRNMGRVGRAISNLRLTPAGLAWSRSDLAAHVATLMLDPDHKTFFPGGDKPAQFEDKETQKIIIMMTDGSNIGCCFTNWPPRDFDNQYVYFYPPYNRAQMDTCQLLKDNNVRIYSILFDVDEADTGGREINNVFARCASGAYGERAVEPGPDEMLKCSERQFCYNVKTNEELIKAYNQIAQTFYRPTITK